MDDIKNEIMTILENNNDISLYVLIFTVLTSNNTINNYNHNNNGIFFNLSNIDDKIINILYNHLQAYLNIVNIEKTRTELIDTMKSSLNNSYKTNIYNYIVSNNNITSTVIDDTKTGSVIDDTKIGTEPETVKNLDDILDCNTKTKIILSKWQQKIDIKLKSIKYYNRISNKKKKIDNNRYIYEDTEQILDDIDIDIDIEVGKDDIGGEECLDGEEDPNIDEEEECQGLDIEELNDNNSNSDIDSNNDEDIINEYIFDTCDNKVNIDDNNQKIKSKIELDYILKKYNL